MRFLLTLVLAATGCGNDSSGGGSGGDDAPAPTVQETPAGVEPGPAPAPGKYPSAMLVPDAAGLPACDATAEGALAYVKAEKGFVACASGKWEAIDLKGAKGDKGDAGAPGEDGEPVAVNQWYDPVAKRRWLFGPGAPWSDTCGGEWRLPTAAEADAARPHGLFIAAADAGAPQVLWTSEETATGVHKAVRADATGFPGHVHTQFDTESYGHFCVDVGE